MRTEKPKLSLKQFEKLVADGALNQFIKIKTDNYRYWWLIGQPTASKRFNRFRICLMVWDEHGNYEFKVFHNFRDYEVADIKKYGKVFINHKLKSSTYPNIYPLEEVLNYISREASEQIIFNLDLFR